MKTVQNQQHDMYFGRRRDQKYKNKIEVGTWT